MNLTHIAMPTLLLTCSLAAPVALAQRGRGEPVGVARLTVKPEVVAFSGIVIGVRTAPCETTTGRSPLGTHFLLEADQGRRLNIHLGPAVQVNSLAKELVAGGKVKVKAFRADKMKKDHYAAQSVTCGEQTAELRDGDLRPVWAGRGRPATRVARYGHVGGPYNGCARYGGRGFGRGRDQGTGGDVLTWNNVWREWPQDAACRARRNAQPDECMN